jgi:hypothetical protein
MSDQAFFALCYGRLSKPGTPYPAYAALSGQKLLAILIDARNKANCFVPFKGLVMPFRLFEA